MDPGGGGEGIGRGGAPQLAWRRIRRMTAKKRDRAISVEEFPEDFPGAKQSGDKRTEGIEEE